jgi:hypothetical protein
LHALPSSHVVTPDACASGQSVLLPEHVSATSQTLVLARHTSPRGRNAHRRVQHEVADPFAMP